MPEQLIQPPVGECIDLAEAKLHLRVTDDAQDLLIASLLSAARHAAEIITRRQLLHARWMQVLDKFPMAGSGTPMPFERVVNRPAYSAALPHSPLIKLEEVRYLDMGSSWQLMNPADYVVNEALEPAIVSPGFGKIWPIPLPQVGSVRITYVAGYASPIKIIGSPSAGSPVSQFRVSGPAQWAAGDLVEFYNSGGALPAGLADHTPYLIVSPGAGGVYSLTDIDGNAVTFTDRGTGASFIGVVPDGIRAWIKIRLGSLYENREEVAILNRGTIGELPFIDGLLDPYRTSLP